MKEEKKKILIFLADVDKRISSIEQVVSNISATIFLDYYCEILIIDNQSTGKIVEEVNKFISHNGEIIIKLIHDPVNNEYGKIQKMAFQYAVLNHFDVIVHLHLDNKNSHVIVGDLILPILNEEAVFVLASRNRKKNTLQILVKELIDKLLAGILNKTLKLKLTDYHSRHRAYSVKSLSEIPFERNSNEFHFGIQIIIQLLISGSKIKQVVISEKYVDSVKYSKDIRYAWNVIKTVILYKLHNLCILYQREFDIVPYQTEYTAKLGYTSSHTMALANIRPNTSVLDMGCNEGYLGGSIKDKGCYLVGMDIIPLEKERLYNEFIELNLDDIGKIPDLDRFDHILLLDVIEHLNNPELFLDKIREKSKLKCPRIIITTPNIAFIVVRMQLLFSQFNYGKQGILDLTHKRLFTFYSLKRLCLSCGYKVKKVAGIPAPFPKALGKNFIGMSLLYINKFFIHISKSLFSYQIYIEIEPTPVVSELLNKSLKHYSNEKEKQIK